MQFCSEFEWISPSGRGLLTHYMPAHYSAGWWMDSSSSLAEAAAATYALFDELKRVALTRNVLLPVGTDYTPPNKWVSEIHRDWAARYTWPRFVCGLPREFFAAVRAELADRGAVASPQTRDMNPIYTGKDVSYIDTKQANRAAENAVLQAERFAVFAGVLCGAPYPQAALAKAWVQLAYGAHHDAITGSESDQVYLDLLTGWRDAWEIGRTVRDNSLQLLSRAVAGPGEAVVVWNPSTRRRTDIVTIELQRPLGAGVAVRGPDGAHTPAHVDADGRTVSWLASDAPSLGWKTYQLIPTDAATGWEPVTGTEIANEHYRLRVDPERGGGVESLVRDHRQLIADGRVGNELAVYQEYPSHPTQGEGPWHLLPNGPVVCSSESADEVRGYRCPIGQRLVVRGRIGTLLRYTQTLTLWRGVPGWTVAPPSMTSAATTSWCACGGPARCRARWRSARWAMPSSGEVSRCCTRSVNRELGRWTRPNTCGHWTTRPTAGSDCSRRCGSAPAATRCARYRWPRWCPPRRRHRARWRAS